MGHARLIALAVVFVATHAAAQTGDLDRARALFAEALRDEDAGRVAVALEKFRAVATTRDTAQVEYRIAACLESLGQKRAALVAYDRATHVGRGDATAADVVASANEHVAALASRMGKIHIAVHGSSSPAVSVDGVRIADEELASAVTLEPGEHIIDVSAADAKPAHSTVVVVQGQRGEVVIDLAPNIRANEPVIASSSYARRNVGLAVGATGLAIALVAGVMLVVRESLIGQIETTCPNDVCPISQHDSIESMRSEAVTLGPVAAVVGGVGAAAVLVGGVLALLGPQRAIAIAPSREGAMLVLRGTF
jgi:hypothetical protein